MYNKSTLLLKNIHESVQNTVKKSFINERTPFYFISTAFLFVTIVLSILSALYSKENYSDFFPNEGIYYGKKIHDNTIVDVYVGIFANYHHTIILVFLFFFLYQF